MIGALAALIVGIASATWLWGAAGAQNPRGELVRDDGHDHVTALDHEGRFTGPGEWPPRHVAAETDLIRGGVRDDNGEIESRTAQVRLDGRVEAALGDDYMLIGSDNPISERPGAEKGELDLDRRRTLFFSYTNNQNVMVFAEGNTVLSVETTPAAGGQPPLTNDEAVTAVEIARAHWEQTGDDRIDELTGYGIRALQDNGQVFDVRMAYVSFHVDEDERPELLTYVDLTNGRVTTSRVDR